MSRQATMLEVRLRRLVRLRSAKAQGLSGAQEVAEALVCASPSKVMASVLPSVTASIGQPC
jgi:hypothetical protein